MAKVPYFYWAPVVMPGSSHVITLDRKDGRVRSYPVAEWSPAPDSKELLVTSTRGAPDLIQARLIAAFICN